MEDLTFTTVLWLVFLGLLMQMTGSLALIWYRAVKASRAQKNSFSLFRFVQENRDRFILCLIGNVIFALIAAVNPVVAEAIIRYLGYGYLGGGFGLGAIIAVISVVVEDVRPLDI